MALAVGTRLGPYEVLAFIGAGGMGEVYKARDTQLGRDVAIKLLPPALVDDAERVARFRREAQALAALSHPHIAQIHGLEQADGNHLLVLELVDGENLATRLARGPIPLDETLSIASQVAEALEAAHEKGIVHRDLKPANVGLTRDGQVKVLDFGLAKAVGAAGEASSLNVDLANSPTISSPAAVTGAGVLLGTAAYMAPEQAKGRPADKRADIWAFGCVLYEMLTAKRAFAGEDVSDTLAAILRGEPDWAALPSEAPPHVRAVITHCLEKDRRRRFSEIATPRYLLDHPPEPTTSARGRRGTAWRVAFAAATLALIVIVALLAALLTRGPASPSAFVTRFSLSLGEGEKFTNAGRQLIAVSPDGNRIVYVANYRLYLRDMSNLVAHPIPGVEGTEGPSGGLTSPVLSPNGQEVAYYTAAEHALKRVPIAGGAAVTICHAENPFGMSWQGDQILFGQGPQGIMRVLAKGGEPDRIVTVKDGEGAASPQLLPDGDHVLYTLATKLRGPDGWKNAWIVVQSVKTGKRTVVVEGAADARYIPTGHLVYAVNGVLLARPFDANSLVVDRSPVAVVEGVRRALAQTGVAQFAFSNTGTLAYIPGPVDVDTAGRNLALGDGSGKKEMLPLPGDQYVHPRISPDGTRLAFGTDDGKDAIVWVYDLVGGTTRRRLTFDGGNRAPIWTPDGLRITFESDRAGDRAMFWQRADGSGTAERLTSAAAGTIHTPQSWSPDGDTLLFAVQKGAEWELALLSRKDGSVTPYGGIHSLISPAASFSPDGQFVVYTEVSKTGGLGLFVQPYPATGAKYQLGAAREAIWRKDGKILAFTPVELSVMNVIEKPSFAFTKPVEWGNPALRSNAQERYVPAETGERNMDLMPDGKRLVGVVRHIEETAKQEIIVVERWFDELNARVAAK
ncbi:MAG: protein kinase domain-containing protein [Bacteroidales bacterium]